MRASHAVPTARERAPQRRLEPAVEPLHPARLEVRDAERGRLDREARVLERADDLLPRQLGRRRIGLDERRAADRSPSASPRRIPGRTPAASAAAVTGPSSGSPTGSGASAAGRSASDGERRSAAFSSNPGMERQAITGTYVLHEHTFPCQPESNS